MICAAMERCAGIDGGKKWLSVCVMTGPLNGEAQVQQRRFGVNVADLESRRDWLAQEGVTHVVMESTGSYWKPIFSVLEDSVKVYLANPQEVNLHRIVGEPGRLLALGQFVEDQHIRDPSAGAGTVEIGGPRYQSGKISRLDFIQQSSRNLSTDLTLPATGAEGCFFRHRAVHFSVHIYVVEKSQFGIGTLSGLDCVAHDPRPVFPPNLQVVL